MGRKRIDIDQRQFEELCAMFCTLGEISAVLGASEDTIQRWCRRTYRQGFRQVYERKSAAGKMSLRRAQMRLAETNAAMAIFLGKNYLGQVDSQQVELTRSDDATVAEMDAYFAQRARDA